MKKLIITSILINLFAICALAQTTEFTFQGSLNVGTPSVPANTPHDFEFRLFSIESGGTAIGTLQRLAVPVTNGVFSVKLDFGAQFPGANRFLEISVRPAGGGGFVPLSPRQPVSNTPYAVRSLNSANADTATTATNAANATNATNAVNATNATNATNAATATNALQLGGVAANQFVLTTDPRMSDARPASSVNFGTAALTGVVPIANGGTGSGTQNFVDLSTNQASIGGNKTFTGNLTVNGTFTATLPSGSGNYIQNTTTQQTSSNFNISGNGFIGGRLGIGTTNPANKVDAVTTTNAYGFVHSDGTRVLGTYVNSVENSGMIGTNSAHPFQIFTSNAGPVATFSTGGSASGKVGIGLSNPTFKLHVIDPTANGLRVQANTAGGYVASFGGVGEFGVDAPGVPAGRFRITELGNVGIGATFSDSKLTVSGAGIVRASINSNTNAGVKLVLNNLAKWSVATVDPGQFQIYNDAIGANAFWIDGATNNVGIGTTNTGIGKLSVHGGTSNGIYVTSDNPGAYVGKFGPTGVFGIDKGAVGGGRFYVDQAGWTQINEDGTTDTSLKLSVNGVIRARLGGFNAANVPVCFNIIDRFFAVCAPSSIRYKENVNDYLQGLDLIRRLRPVTYNWKAGGQEDLGLIAEEVAKEEPQLAMYNEKGEINGVRYDRVGVIAVNAIKEQQAQIEEQAKQIAEQKEINRKLQAQIDLLTKIICKSDPTAEICKEEK
ncbi:MAG: tail fiber domain-containing protein [Blastocatellia bacterium]